MQLDAIKKHEEQPKHYLALSCSTSPATYTCICALIVYGHP